MEHSQSQDSFIKKSRVFLTRLMREYHIPYFTYVQRAIEQVSPAERIVLWVLMSIFAFSAANIVLSVHNEATTQVPVRGGTIKEGVIGAPRFINPLLATSDTDRDLTMLLYSGLMRPAADGTLVPDLAERYSISKDGTEYSFVLRDNIHFHDGTPVTADDIVFTIERAQDPAIKSNRRADWDGVRVEKINAREVRFTLPHPYAPFLENTTLGIIPRHIWLNVSPQEFAFSKFNTQPIGSGPFKLKKIDYNSSGIPARYMLRAFNDYALGRPYINTFNMRFYANEDDLLRAYESGSITSMSAVSSARIQDVIKNESALLRIAFPRIFAIFLNQNKNHILADKAVREALTVLIDKQGVLDDVLNGYGTIIDSPIPPSTVDGQYIVTHTPITINERHERARDILESAGWKYDEEHGTWSDGDQLLSFTLATANTPELKRAANAAATAWNEFGIPVKISVFETGELNQNIIRPRDYEALLFGEVVGRSLDLFAFWHSSQKDDPGLNIASYTNASVDEWLEKARTKSNKADRDALYVKAEDALRSDVPAVFLYAPDFLYIVPQKVRGVDTLLVATPAERFAQVYLWHTQTERVWNFFTKDMQETSAQ